MKPSDFMNECTTAGAVAPVAQPLGKTISRSGKKGGNLFKGKKTNKPFYEDAINEEDKIISPDKGSKTKTGLHGKDKNTTELSKFLPPFKAQGLWVSDRRGNNVLEVTKHGTLAAEIANALNSQHITHECFTPGGVIAGGGVGESEELHELRSNDIRDILKRALQKEKEQIANRDMVGAARTGKQIAAIYSRLQQREKKQSNEPKQSELFAEETGTEITEASYNHLVAKFMKDGKAYHLWNDGNYLYNLTRVIDGVPKHVHHWPQADLEQVEAELLKRGYTKQSHKGLAPDITKQGVEEGLNWSSLDEGLSLDDKMSIFEEFYTTGNLTEAIDDDKRKYFESLVSMSDTPTKNKRYIVVPLSLVGNRILPLDQPSYSLFLGKTPDKQLAFRLAGEVVKYPSTTMRDLSVFNTFIFSSTDVYNKFRVALSLKFDISLPEIDIEKMQDVEEGFMKTAKRVFTGKDIASRFGQEYHAALDASEEGDKAKMKKHNRNARRLAKVAKLDAPIKIGSGDVPVYESHGISAEDLADSIFYRLERMYPDIVTRHGHEVVGDAIMDVADFHAGAEEVGSSDISGMVREVLRILDRSQNKDDIEEDCIEEFTKVKQGVAEGTDNIEVGDKITWWYNKFHPNYEGIVRKVQGNTIIVYAPGSGELYQLTKDDIRSHKKQGVAESTQFNVGDIVRHNGSKTKITYDYGDGYYKIHAIDPKGEKNWKKVHSSTLKKEQGVSEGFGKSSLKAQTSGKQLIHHYSIDENASEVHVKGKSNMSSNILKGVSEAQKKKVTSGWDNWNSSDYADEHSFYNGLSQAILSYVAEKFGGKAWFKGGSFAYLVDTNSPNTLVSSDGGKIKVSNVAKGLEDYCDRGIVGEFAEADPLYWNEYFRPVRKESPIARDGAPMYGSEQGRHELGNLGYEFESVLERKMKPVRTYQAGGPDDPAVKAKLRAKEKYAKGKEGRLAELRMEPIVVAGGDVFGERPEVDANTLEKLADDSGVGMSGRVEDYNVFIRGSIEKDGVRVAAVKLNIFVDIDLTDMYDQQTIDKMYGGETHTMESFTATVYRDPKNPKQLRMSF